MPTLSPSQKRTWLDCRGRWDFGYRQGLVPVEEPAERLTVGKYVQEVLRRYHTEPASRRSLQGLMDDLADVWDGELSKDSQNRAVAMLKAFWEAFGTDAEVPVVPTELEVRWTLPNGVVAHGILDEVEVRDDAIIIGENKTGEAPDPEFYTFFNPQVYDYAWLLSKQYPSRLIYARHTLLSPKQAQRYIVEIKPHVLEETEREWLVCASEMFDKEPAIVYNRTFRCERECPYYLLCLLRLTGGNVDEAKSLSYRKGR